ncbi:MAG TPA: nucleotide sugar dehydrogenase, partial [Fervidobacterium sp.]|nr:nucleotide sugar dehydrogenase [Fervidobacterium sp.]
MSLYEKILGKNATVGVIGIGYVGLPLAVEKARAGFKVVGFDIQQKRVDMVNRGENYIGDVDDDELKELVNSGKLRATTNFDELANCDVVSICVPTPLDQFKQPDLSYIVNSANEVKKRLRKNQLIVLESTTYPGTTEEVVLPILEETGLKVGKDFYLAFSPERVDPGNPRYKTRNTPKVVGGVTPDCTKHAVALYESVLEAGVFPVSSPRAAEMTKILENTFRLVNIALVQEMTKVAEKMGVNIWEVIEAASTKPFGYMPFYPGPGIGGHCIPIDPFYLVYKAKEYDEHMMLVEVAGEISDDMPYYVVDRLSDILNDRRECLNGANI